ncbi:MAG TPA: GH116 family glycosyl hydrolase [Nitrososphaera sp.]|nr:GH116 family glycosyl hydrolase [Nitrososphaera sp.]
MAAASSFDGMVKEFMESTEHFVEEGVNPGGYYKAIWCRDASYILRDWFLSGRFEHVMQEILYIWSHQIAPDREKVIYGRGSPEMKYLSHVASPDLEHEFSGALPTTIFRGFSEVYGQSPDIDSTALMISSTSWILDAYIRSGLVSASSYRTSDMYMGELRTESVVSDAATVRDFVVPKMLKAVDYLASRDIDGDGLLEQGHNEDWMDTVLRAGKIVYSQGCWILALKNLASLLAVMQLQKEADRLSQMAMTAMNAVEQNLWVRGEGTYADKQETHHTGGPYRTLTQDISLYLVAVTENTFQDVLSRQSKEEKRTGQQTRTKPEHEIKDRAVSALDAIKSRIWNDKNIPLVTEVQLLKTGPWVLEPDQYHNHTFWPWTTGIEMLARSRFGRVDECETLLSRLVSKVDAEKNNIVAFYEWVHPVSLAGAGAFPFRTGISAIRIAISEITASAETRSKERRRGKD